MALRMINVSRKMRSLLVDMAKLACITDVPTVRWYSKEGDDSCRRALADIPPETDPKCPHASERKKKKKVGFLHRIKMKVIEGGTNFGTPFRKIQCSALKQKEKEKEEEEQPEPPKALPAPVKPVPTLPPVRPGVQVSILGADTSIGQYVALLLKQCPCIKKLRLYEAKDTQCSCCNRDLQKVVQDLQHIDTNCRVQAFSCACFELERCLQNTDIVLMLESGYVNVDMPPERRFNYQAPIVKRYATAIAHECPRAFIIVCATPIECMVPLVAETLKETNWYDPRKLMGSLAVPEMRASTLAARALCLEPRYTRVPCVGGTEGESLVPLFSKAVEFFDFAKNNAEMMTTTLRTASSAIARTEGRCILGGDLSEAHALAGLVSKVAYALLCQDLPKVTGFVETDSSQVISPVSYLAIDVILNRKGICKRNDFPFMNAMEKDLMDIALQQLESNVKMAMKWYYAAMVTDCERQQMGMQKFFHVPKKYAHVESCMSHAI
ncbi:malate dehydrogenase, mitochondrial-like isoform X1 [Plodia interpunctella]|uniref:malate dehydrogenase, mitochondrial-like isoform X1 n=1 Tax=Plodia interpunctella TaxID=58824 RepID=UPI002368A62C|nr:malate dehydrogenase, mitochondrial-like isoform X1 [Plodia interpunctella]